MRFLFRRLEQIEKNPSPGPVSCVRNVTGGGPLSEKLRNLRIVCLSAAMLLQQFVQGSEFLQT